MKKIIFVCTGNTCRSPMAEALFRNLLEKKNIDGIEVGSAGIATVDGLPVSKNSAAVMAEIGIDISDHQSVLLNEDMLDSFFVITMTEQQKALLEQYGFNCAAMPHEVSDPYGGDIERYRKCRDEIAAQLPEILAMITDNKE